MINVEEEHHKIYYSFSVEYNILEVTMLLSLAQNCVNKRLRITMIMANGTPFSFPSSWSFKVSKVQKNNNKKIINKNKIHRLLKWLWMI